MTDYPINEQRLVDEYDFRCHHLRILTWFGSFQISGRMYHKKRKEDGKEYYWVKYNKLLKDCPTLHSVRCIGNYLDDLSGNKDPIAGKQYPLVKWVKRETEGFRVFIRFNEPVMSYLCGGSGNSDYPYDDRSQFDEQDSATEGTQKSTVRAQRADSATAVVGISQPTTAVFSSGRTMISRHHKTKHTTGAPRKDISKRTRRVLETVLQEGTPFSKHRINDIGTPASKTVYTIDRLLRCIVAGKFTSKCELDPTWARGVNLEVLDQFIDDWTLLEERLLDAGQIYKDWIENSEMNLPRSFSTFLYNPRTKKSLFISCLTKPHTQDGFAGKQVLDRIAKTDKKSAFEIAKIAEQRPAWNRFVFCEAMQTIWHHISRNWYQLKEINQHEWSYRRAAQLIENYGIFLLKTNNANPNYMAYGKYLWDRFVDDFYGATEIDLDPEKLKKTA